MGQIENSDLLIQEINEFIHSTINTKWMIEEWGKLEGGADPKNIHPLVNVAFRAHKQIQGFIMQERFGITEEIFELFELAFKVNNLKRKSVVGIEERIQNLTSHNFTLYRTARYEIQVAGMLLGRGYAVDFIEPGAKKTPDIFASYLNVPLEVECKHKDPTADQLDYIKSLYNNTQTARKQFSKKHVSMIMIDIDRRRFDEFQEEMNRLKEEINRALRNSTTISAIFLTSKIALEETADYIYRHRVLGFTNPNARYVVPLGIIDNLISTS